MCENKNFALDFFYLFKHGLNNHNYESYFDIIKN